MLGANWVTDKGEKAENAGFKVVTMREGSIIDIQDCRSRKSALKLLSQDARSGFAGGNRRFPPA